MTETPEHLTIKKSDRGFGNLPEIPGAYGGNARAYESSGAEQPRVWLAVTVPLNSNHPERGDQESVIHLEAEDAWRLAEQLMALVQSHYQGDSRPGKRVYDEVPGTPFQMCNWKVPEYVQVELGTAAYREVILTCEYPHGAERPARVIDSPVTLDHRVSKFFKEHQH